MKIHLLIQSVFLFFLFGQAHALELHEINFQSDSVHLQFSKGTQTVTVKDAEGWLTLRTLTLLVYQDVISSSYIGKSAEAPLSRFSPAIRKTLQLLKSQNTSEDAVDRIDAALTSGVFSTDTSAKRTTEKVLNGTLVPILKNEKLAGTLSLYFKNKKGQEEVITQPRISYVPTEIVSYELSASLLDYPAAVKYRTPSRIDWDASRLKIKGL